MSSWAEERTRLKRSKELLKTRSRLLQTIREFFTSRGFIETETPVLIPVPATELHIDAIESGSDYLRTSPELHMKRLLAAGYERIFQMGPCFRANERGRRHNPEYTMLEWYRADASYSDILVDMRALISAAVLEITGKSIITYKNVQIDVEEPWERIYVKDAFIRHAGWNPVANYDADRFDSDLVERVEPALPPEKPVILTDYPVDAAGLSRAKEGDSSVAERWELYIGGIELANAFSELTDPIEQRKRFEKWSKQRESHGSPEYALDETFIESLADMPPSAAGVAVGIDRLLMLLTDTHTLDDILPFREPVD